jgi:hypothetical protein
VLLPQPLGASVDVLGSGLLAGVTAFASGAFQLAEAHDDSVDLRLYSV